MESVVPEIYDKQIIEIDMENAVLNIDDFYVDIQQPIRNAVYIKIMQTSIELKTNFNTYTYTDPQSLKDAASIDITSIKLNNEDVLDNDPIYISMNNYNRISTVIKQTYSENVVKYNKDANGNKIETKEIQTVTKPTVFEYFDMIHVNLTNVYHLFRQYNAALSLGPQSITFKNEYQQSAFDPNDTSVYILNPIEPSLKRFNIELRDKKNQLLKTSEIASFKMTICVYSKQKKF